MAAITATPDTSLVRVLVELAGWAADGPVTVTGSAGGASWPVRSITATSGGVVAGYDYEAPLLVPVTYTAYDGSTLVTSTAVTVSVDQCMLRAPGLPALDVVVEVIGTPQVKRSRDRVVLRPIGRRTGVPLTGALSAGEFMLGVRTRSDGDALALDELLAQSSTVLLLMPGTRLAREYVSTGGLDESPLVSYRAQTSDPEDVGRWAEWAVECVVVDRPEGGVYGDPTASYQAGLDAYATYQDSLDAQAIYLDRLR